MINREDKKLIETYGLLLQVSMPLLVMSFVPIVLWGLLVMIDDLVFDSQSFFDMGLYVALGFCVLCLVGFSYTVLRVKFGTSGKRWAKLLEGKQRIAQNTDMHFNAAMSANGTMAAGQLMSSSENEFVSGAGAATQVAGAVETISVAADQTATMMANVQAVADYYYVDIPSPKKYVAAIFVVPILVTVGVFIPEFISSHEYSQAELARVSEAIAPIKASYEKTFPQVSADDDEEKTKNAYWITARMDDELNTYVLVELDSEGMVDEINYHMCYPVDASPEEAVDLLNTRVLELEKPLAESGASAAKEAIVTTNEIPEQLVSEFLENGVDENFFSRVEQDDVMYSLAYYPEKHSNEAYFYFSVEHRPS